MIEAQVPEFADGGYWYVVPTEEYKPNHRRPVVSPPEWTAVYGSIAGTAHCLLRSPSPWLYAAEFPVLPRDMIAAAASDGYLPEVFTQKPGMRNASEM